MRLLNASTIKVEEFVENAMPKYAILSHTWGAEEVTLQDMLSPTPPSHKKGYQKLLYSCRQTKGDNLEYIWIDTCCIDKTSSAELSEAINSMFQWYKKSSVCYIYLSDFPDTAYLGVSGSKHYLDVPSATGTINAGSSDLKYRPGGLFSTGPTDLGSLGSSFENSRWFTRGWTLQELIAPEKRIFFSADWTAIGCALTLEKRRYSNLYEHLPEISTLLGRITGIDLKILAGGQLCDISIARRMSWAANRNTTRTEDIAYCLMGIFDVNMPLLYGEGTKAFKRLQEEILKYSDDDSIFAHSASVGQSNVDSSIPSILAQSPACFAGWEHIEGCPRESRGTVAASVPATLTSKGLRVQLPLCSNPGFGYLALLDCKVGDNSLTRLAVALRGIPLSKDQFWRSDSSCLRLLNPGRDGPGHATLVEYFGGRPSTYTPNPRSNSIEDVRLETIYVVSEEYSSREKVGIIPYFQLKDIPKSRGSSLLLENVYPREWWDEEVHILRNPAIQSLDTAWVAGVLSFKDKKTRFVLDIILGGTPANLGQSGKSPQSVPEPWCRVTCINNGECNMPNNGDTRLKHAFDAAVYNYVGQVSVTTAPWIGSLRAKVTFDKTEFLGRKGFMVQVEIS